MGKPRAELSAYVLPDKPVPSPETIHMRLVVATEEGDTFNLDVSNDIELENLQALLEAEVSPLRAINNSQLTAFFLRLSLTSSGHLDRSSVAYLVWLTRCRVLFVQSGIPSGSQTLFYAGRPLSDLKATLNSFGVAEDDMILVKKTPTAGPSGSVAGR